MWRNYRCVVVLIFGVLCACVSVQHIDSDFDIYHGENVVRLLDQTRAIYKEKFSETRKRHRRQTNTANRPFYSEQNDLWTLKGFENFKGCPGVLQKFQVFEVNGSFYAAVVHGSSINNTHIYKFSVDEGCQDLLVVLQTKEAFDFAIVPLNEPEAVSVITIERDSTQTYHTYHPGSQVYALTFSKEKEVNSRKGEILLSSHPTCITTWIQYEVPHLAICNSKTFSTEGFESYHGYSYIFRASGGYFDHTSSVPSHNPKKIINFKIVSKYYLAVANHPNITEGRDVATTIFQYDLNDEAYKHLQDLTSKGAVDVCFFTIGSEPQTEHFLVIANQFTFDSSGNIDYNVNSFIYKFAGERFEPFQIIPTTNVTNCLAYQTEDGHLALLFSEATGTTVYQYDGWIFVSDAQYTQYTQQAMGVGIVSIATASLNGNLYITVANNNSELSDSDNMFLPEFQHFSSTVIKDAYSKCSEYQSYLNQDLVSVITDIYNHTIKLNDTYFELGYLNASSVTARQLNTSKLVSSDGRILDSTTVTILQDLSIAALDLANKLNSSDYKHMKAIRATGDYTIQGEISIDLLTSSCGEECFIAEMSPNNLNEIDVSNLFSNVIYLSDTDIPATLRFASLVVERNIDTGLLGGRNVDEYLNFDRDIDFHGTTKFNGNIVFQDNIAVAGQVNEKTISSTSLLLKAGDQQLTWELQVGDVVFNSSNVELLNDVRVGDYYMNAITTASNFTLIEPTFVRGLNTDNLVHHGLLNGIDVADMYENAMKLDGDQIVTGSHTYNMIELGHLVLQGELNGRLFPDDFVLISGESLEKEFSGTLHLMGDTTFNSISAREKVADITVTNGQLDVLMKTANNIQVTGLKTFISGLSFSDINSNSVNSFPADHFDKESSIYGNPEVTLVYENLRIPDSLKVVGSLTVGDLLGIELMKLKENAIEVTNEEFPLSVTFESNVEVLDDLRPQIVNQVLGEDFISKIHLSIEIQGEKRFTTDVKIEQPVVVETTVNDNDLSTLWNDVLRIHGDQVIEDSFTIESDVVVTKIQSARTRVGNREFDNFISLNGIGVLSGVKRFAKLGIKGNWTADSLTVDGLFNNINVADWNGNTLFKAVDNQQVVSKKTIANFIISDAQIESLENVDLKKLTGIVRTDRPGTVYSDLTFVGSLQSRDVYLNNINGVDSNAPLSWLLYEIDQNLTGGVIVEGKADIRSFYDQSSLINDINVEDLAQAIRIDENVSLPYLQFENLVARNLDVRKIQGIMVPDDLVLKSSNSSQAIQGIKSFSNKILVGDSMRTELVNGDNVTTVCLPTAQTGPEDWIVQGNLIIQGGIVNISYVNNDLLIDLNERIWHKDKSVKLQYFQNFENVLFNGNFTGNGIVNGIDLPQVSQNFLSISSTKEQVITGSHVYDTLIVQGAIEAVQLESNSINGITFNLLNESVLLRSVEQDLYNNIVFRDVEVDNIILDGTVNGIRIEDLMHYNRSRVIKGRKTLSSLSVEGDATLCDVCSVDSVRLPEWAPKVILRSGNFTISHQVNFTEIVLEQPVVLGGKFDGVFVNENLLTRQDEQEIIGKMTISSILPTNVSDVVYEKLAQGSNLATVQKLQVDGSYNGVDVDRLLKKSVRRDKDVVLQEAVSLSRLSSESFIDSSVNSTIHDLLDLEWVPLAILDDNLQQLRQYASEIDGVVGKQAVELLFFEEASLETDLFEDIATIYTLESADGQLVFCAFSDATKQLFCNSSSPLLSSVNVVSVVGSRESSGHFAVCLSSSTDMQASSILYSWEYPEPVELQRLSFNNIIDCNSLTVNEHSCFLFIENETDSSLFCRPTGTDEPYSLYQQLPNVDANRVAVCNKPNDNPLVAIISGSSQSSSRLTMWGVDTDGQLKLQRTRVTSPATSIDCVCSSRACYLITLSPSKPLAISGDITVWRVANGGIITRLQRIPVSEPIAAKLAVLPNGRLCLFILQCGGTNTILVYTEQGMSQFIYTTTVHVSAGRDLNLVVNNRRLVLAVAVKNTQDGSQSLRVYQAKFLGL